MEEGEKARLCRYVALDIHKYFSVVAGVDRDGKEILPACRVEHLDLENWLAKHLQQTDRDVIESTTNAWHVYDLLEPLVAEVQVANPIKVKQIACARVKTEENIPMPPKNSPGNMFSRPPSVPRTRFQNGSNGIISMKVSCSAPCGKPPDLQQLIN